MRQKDSHYVHEYKAIYLESWMFFAWISVGCSLPTRWITVWLCHFVFLSCARKLLYTKWKENCMCSIACCFSFGMEYKLLAVIHIPSAQREMRAISVRNWYCLSFWFSFVLFYFSLCSFYLYLVFTLNLLLNRWCWMHIMLRSDNKLHLIWKEKSLFSLLMYLWLFEMNVHGIWYGRSSKCNE